MMAETIGTTLSAHSTVAEAIAYWLESKQHEVQPSTLKG